MRPGVSAGGVRHEHHLGESGLDGGDGMAGVRDRRCAADVSSVDPTRVDAEMVGDLGDRHLACTFGREGGRCGEPVDIGQL